MATVRSRGRERPAAERLPRARNGLARIGVAIEQGLLRRFDAWLAGRGGGSRSEALRDLVRDRLIAAEIDERAEVVASVSIVYDHHHRELSRRLTDLQHEQGEPSPGSFCCPR